MKQLEIVSLIEQEDDLDPYQQLINIQLSIDLFDYRTSSLGTLSTRPR